MKKTIGITRIAAYILPLFFVFLLAPQESFAAYRCLSLTGDTACYPGISNCVTTLKCSSSTCKADPSCDTPPPATNAAATNAPAAPPPPPTKLTNPLGDASVETLIGRAVQIITGISGSVALLMFVYGGFLWVTSQGSSDKVKKGKQVFISATLGLFIIFGSYALVKFVLDAIGGEIK